MERTIFWRSDTYECPATNVLLLILQKYCYIHTLSATITVRQRPAFTTGGSVCLWCPKRLYLINCYLCPAPSALLLISTTNTTPCFLCPAPSALLLISTPNTMPCYLCPAPTALLLISTTNTTPCYLCPAPSVLLLKSTTDTMPTCALSPLPYSTCALHAPSALLLISTTNTMPTCALPPVSYF